MKTEYINIQPYITKDSSEVRELMHPNINSDMPPDMNGVRNQSLAEAIVPMGANTLLHRHIKTEEIYHISQGRGKMTLGEESFNIKTGDTVCISPGTPHMVKNTGTVLLKILCCCSPAYSHEDTKLCK
ncbi:cupin domain-containing protein [Desulfobacterales bacterium HSG17]|nr:cupin domain-containing protein [Desulfobacterales bacterium HSG17]